jgi:hypothetical protein
LIGQLGGVLRQIPETAQLEMEMASLAQRVEQLRDATEEAALCAEGLSAL